MDIFFQIIWVADREVWVAIAYEKPTVKGQPPRKVAEGSGAEPGDALQTCCERLEE